MDFPQLKTNKGRIYEDLYKYIIGENVKGLLSARWTKEGKKGEIFEDVKNGFYNADKTSGLFFEYVVHLHKRLSHI